MKRSLVRIGLAFCLAVVLAACSAGPGYKMIKKIHVGGEGGWDYLTVDSEARRLYVSHGSQVVVIDIDADKVAGNIPDTQGVHGIALAPELNRGFISCGKTNTAVIFDLKTLKSLGVVKTGKSPDAILYEPVSKTVFTFNGGSKDATAFSAATGKSTGTIPLGGKPEFGAADGTGKVYVNIEDTNEVAEIDAKNLKVLRRFPLKPGEEPTGLAFDVKSRHIFSGCHNKLMVIIDADKGAVAATVPIGSGVDAVWLDDGYAFSSNGEGTVSVVKEASKGKFEAVETIQTIKGSRTMAVDAKTHKLYLPTAQFEPAPETVKGQPRKRPAMIKDTFEILVVGE